MPTQTPSKTTGARKPQTTDQPEKKQAQVLPSIRAVIDWLNQKDDGNVRASGSLTIGGAFAVHGVKIVSGQKGEFVSMPNFKKGDEYKDIFHAVTKEAREQMNEAFMKAYEQKLAEQNQDQEQGGEPVEDEQSEAPADDPDEEEGQVMSNM